ncbi:MAG: hypothetical protein R2864_08110 [Syntrophotaleaceae bacterium]
MRKDPRSIRISPGKGITFGDCFNQIKSFDLNCPESLWFELNCCNFFSNPNRKEYAMLHVINADPHGKIALQAYDPVAFHTIGKAMKGNPAILAEYCGYKFAFASEDNKATFEQQPRNIPACLRRHYCPSASPSRLVSGRDRHLRGVDGRLVLQAPKRSSRCLKKTRPRTCARPVKTGRKWNRKWRHRQRLQKGFIWHPIKGPSFTRLP